MMSLAYKGNSMLFKFLGILIDYFVNFSLMIRTSIHRRDIYGLVGEIYVINLLLHLKCSMGALGKKK